LLLLLFIGQLDYDYCFVHCCFCCCCCFCTIINDTFVICWLIKISLKANRGNLANTFILVLVVCLFIYLTFFKLLISFYSLKFNILFIIYFIFFIKFKICSTKCFNIINGCFFISFFDLLFNFAKVPI